MSRTRSLEVTQQSSHEWHALASADVCEALRVDPEKGLTKTEVTRRRKKYGRNTFTEVREPGVFVRAFKQIKSPLVFVLLIAFVITLALQEFVDSAVILFALSIAIVVGVVQEGKASKAFQKLAQSQVHRATLVRGSALHEVDADELVPGDIVVIESGGQAPADIRLLETKKLAMNEAALTGEWLPVRKENKLLAVGEALTERTNMVWMGTYAVEGYGKGVVIATGDSTAVGQLAQDLHDIDDEMTPLQEEMKRISQIMLYIISVLTVLIFAIGMWQGQPLTEMLLMSIAIAVASIPEGLPAAVTIILAVGMESLLKRGGLVRNLLAAETLGSTTVVMTDKTGTLTLARMALTGVIYADRTNMSPTSWERDKTVRAIFDTSLAATSAYREKVNGQFIFHGDPVEKAILEAALEIDIDPEKDSSRAQRTDHLAFESENRFAAGLVPENKTRSRLCVNGAPEFLLARASHVYGEHGARTMTEEDRAQYESAIAAQTKEGKRLVAVAYRDVAFDAIPEDREPPERMLTGNLVFMGILVFNDPVRKRVASAIRGVQSAGARVLLITGDNPQTALTVARAVGIAGAHDTAVTGDELEKLSDEELRLLLEDVSVFARTLPRQKMRIAEILQKQGEIVAMTGDGINDAPALRRANIGIAVGSGTEVAKEASDLVLVNDSFEIIYAAIEEGRRIIANLRKIVGYLLSTCLSEVVLIAGALVTGGAAPLLPAQILWANVIEEGLMSFAFAFEKGERDAMKRRPQDIHEEGILSSGMMWFIVFVVTVHGLLLLALYFFLRLKGIPLEELRSVMFLMIAIDSLFMAFAFRSLTTPLWRIPLRTNLFFLGSFAVSASLLAIVLTVPFFQYLLSYQPLPLYDVMLVAGYSVIVLLIIEVSKWLFFERQEKVVE
ncbi:MAG: HAD-IC family P-type ATPase [Candidatus Paceibacterota bacterium]